MSPITPQKAAIQEAIDALRQGRAVVFPTDTVYGVGVAVEHAASPEEVYALKHRASDKPVAWLVAGLDDLRRYGRGIPGRALELARLHWPGALTLVVRASGRVPEVFAPSGTIGLRMPADECALALVRAVGPIAASSANRSGQAPPRFFSELDPRIRAEVAVALPGDATGSSGASSGVASTVVDATGDELRVLRQGGVAL